MSLSRESAPSPKKTATSKPVHPAAPVPMQPPARALAETQLRKEQRTNPHFLL